MMLARRQLLAGATATALAGAAMAQSAPFPNMPIRVVVPFAPGGTGDVVARILGDRAGAELGQPMIIENRSGANGVVGAQFVARARPDGHTLLRMATAHVILPSLQQLPYDWERDLVPVFGVTATPLVFAVRGNSGIRSFEDLAALARARQGGVDYASGGAGSVSHLAAITLVKALNIRATHIPYRGFAGAVEALRGDQVHLICVTVADVIEMTRSGDFRLLGVAAARRQAELPDAPTMAELGFADFVASSWNAYLAPAGTPASVVARLFEAFSKASGDPAVQQQFARLSVQTISMSQPDLLRFLREEAARWRRVVEENAIRLEN